MPKEYRVGDLIAVGGPANRPSRLVVSTDGNAVGYIPIYWVSNGMPQVAESGAGTVVGNVVDLMNNQQKTDSYIKGP